MYQNLEKVTIHNLYLNVKCAIFKKKIYSSKFDETSQNQWSTNKAIVNSTIAIGN